ncbi:MAG TPA: CBS domain-containing protein [Solirubrobacteraceae bacterium]|nr:CBS domain-containing protein [Solirubrobacteraceae bacterium]
MSITTSAPSTGSYLMPSLRHATVGDAMHPGILYCEPDLSLTEVARIMATHHVHCVGVIGISHKDPECPVWSMISDVDLLKAAVEGDEQATARSLASEPLVSIDARTPLAQAAAVMVRHDARHLIVLEPDTQRPVGILSTLDVAGVLGWGEA